MSSKSKTTTNITHPFLPVYDENSEYLILGSFPSVKSRKEGFYYGHPQNRFWKIMENLYDVQLVTIEGKKAFLLSHHIALYDVVMSCTITGSSDASIQDVICTDLLTIVQHSNIKKVITNGKLAESLYQKYQYPLTNIQSICLPSTSSANAKVSLAELIELYRKELRCVHEEN